MVRIKNRNRESVRICLFHSKTSPSFGFHKRPRMPFSFKNITFIWLPQTSSYAFFIQKHHLHLASTNILVCLFHSKTSPSFGFHKRVRVCLFHSKTSPSFGFHKQINFYSHTFYSRPFYTILKKL